MPEQRRLEALAPPQGGEVPGLTPAELIEIGHQVVVSSDEQPIILFSTLRAGIVEPGVLINHGFHFIRGEIREGTKTRSFGGHTGHLVVLPRVARFLEK